MESWGKSKHIGAFEECASVVITSARLQGKLTGRVRKTRGIEVCRHQARTLTP